MPLDPLQEVWKRWKALGSPDVLVGVSGGADSVALALVLDELRRTLASSDGPRVTLAHVDHGLREDSAEDAAFVTVLSERLGLGLRSVRLEPSESAWIRGDPDAPPPSWVRTRSGDSLQARARDVRRTRLEAWREELGGLTALAHTLDDQAETLLLSLARGAAGGLGGMQERGPGELWRPLLGVRRRALRDWLDARGESWREDPSNGDPRFDRVRMRREVLPLLEEIRPGVAGALARLAGELAEDAAWMDSLIEPVPLTTTWAAESPPALVRRTLRARLEEHLGRPPSWKLVAEILAVLHGARTGAEVPLPDGGRARLTRDGLRLIPPEGS